MAFSGIVVRCSWLVFIFSIPISRTDGLPSRPGTNILLRDTDDQTVVQYSKVGNCYTYISIQERDDHKSLAPCNIFCEETKPGVNGYSCESLMKKEDWTEDPSLINKDDMGYIWVIGKCTCGGAVVELAEEITGIVADALEQLDKLLCGILLQASVSVAEIGVNFIPGSQVLGIFTLCVRAAKHLPRMGFMG
ncbi:hypothetical protein BKA65DRAFT_481273 [Rhexocercosporidium sp. MPI-PUGE-AT-0058]|nr:hypothetical protein BKA65DRAFT_481273 [Rhexocercosporidium sp. MPI-PUGE-AT-0058]